MKKFILKLKHNTLFGFVLGIMLCSGIVYGVNTYESDAIKYSPTDSSWEVDNVNDAINSLYGIATELETTKTSLNDLKSLGNATAAQILSGKTAVVKGSTIAGTMTNRGAVTSTLNAGGSYTIPAGYHNGSGKVTVNTLASQTSATATASDIKSGKTAWVNGSKVTGTASTTSAVYCGTYTANGSFNITTYGLSNVDVNNFIFVPKMSQVYSYASPAHVGSGYGYDNYLYVRGYGSYVPHTFTLNGNTLSFTLPAANGSAYNGPTLDNATAKVGGNWNVPVTGAIYYIG